jgi:hypothetical protein
VGKDQTVPYGTDSVFRGCQALRTWLPSYSPFGTKIQPLSANSAPDQEAAFEDEDDDEDENEEAVGLAKAGPFVAMPFRHHADTPSRLRTVP